eukprot:4143674-Alexandrium_andersonii.AAC.1
MPPEVRPHHVNNPDIPSCNRVHVATRVSLTSACARNFRRDTTRRLDVQEFIDRPRSLRCLSRGIPADVPEAGRINNDVPVS